VNYREAQSVVADYKALTGKAEAIYAKLQDEEKDAFYELVLFPTKASALVNELYVTAGKNALYEKQRRATTNDLAEETRELFRADTALMGYFNRSFANGKWNHFMDQSHLGYTNWQDPPTNSLRAMNLYELDVPGTASMGVAVEGSEAAWPGTVGDPVLPLFDPFNKQRHYIEVFNRGQTAFDYAAKADKPWIEISAPRGEVRKEARIWIDIDWNKTPKGDAQGTVTVAGAHQNVSVNVRISVPSGVAGESFDGFMQGDGYISIEAEHYTKKTESGSNRWTRIEGYGHTLSAMRTTSPAHASPATPGKDSPCLEYRAYLLDSGNVDVEGIFGATLNFMPGRGLQYAVSFDDDPPQIVTLVPQKYSAQDGNRDWGKSVMDNARHSHTTHLIDKPGSHTLKIWMVDPGVVLEKIVVDCGGVRPSYLGPPESFHRAIKRDIGRGK
jgi:hypothetical protein